MEDGLGANSVFTESDHSREGKSCGLDVEPEVAFCEGHKLKDNMKKLQIAIFAASLAGAMSASAALLVDRGLPYAQPSTDLSWSDQESSATPPGGYMDAGGSFSIGGSGTYTVTGITVWDVVNTSAGAPTTGLSLLNASGSTISSSFIATPATYGNQANYVAANPDDYPPATLYKVVFTVDVPVSAGSPYDFFLNGPLTLYPNGNYYNSFLLCNDASSDPVLWLENLGLLPGTSPSVGTYSPDYNGDAYVVVTGVPEPTTMMAGALLLLPFGASTLRILRKRQTA